MWNIFFSSVSLRWKWWAKRPLEVSVLFLIVPLAMFLLTTIIQGVGQKDGIPIVVVDKDQSNYSQLVIERVAEHPIVSVERSDEEEAIRLLQTQKVEAVFIFNEGFMEKLHQADRKQLLEMLHTPSSLVAGLLTEVFTSEVNRLASNSQAAHYVSRKYEELGLIEIEEKRHETSLWQESWEHTDSYWEPEPLMSIRYFELDRFSHIGQRNQIEIENGGLVRYELQLLMGWLSALLLFVLIFVAQWLVEEKQNGILKRLKSTAASPFFYVIGHSFPAFIFAFIQGGFTFVMIFWLYDFVVPLTLELLILFFMYFAAAFSLSLCIAIFVKTTGQLQAVGIFIVLLTSLVGGSFIDLGEWISFFKWLSYGTPQGWFLHGFREGAFEPALFGFVLLFSFFSIGRWRKQL
ncbi:hypothetical protein BKP45_06695 [Anaerobacillus alkalidiazotrophicus]|uniref:ABC-2 type transporter transmembrane domain-containing protein n=1 Tax=Anaerobacillus alkalidiazotrophicus TaxID=472963 RepID=A0A1S2MC02_9BACI|nr:ABC transporter permease [Anaerobacillus alkalidiazotrophicus]OIJ22322.1 hypothetical protein BKP45_06695 [Anaerobacillus alkalidiazotrophicus]